MSEIRKTSFNIPLDLKTNLKIRAAKNNTTLTDLVIKYLEEGLERDKKKE